jgi:PAS domain S-box-containing protein
MMLSRTEGIAHVGSWVWEIATDTVTWSDELFRIFQRDPREGAPSFAEHPAFYHPDDMARLKQAVEVAVADGTSSELELRAIRKDGETRTCIARGVVEMAPDGRPVRLFGSLQDITERKKAEEALIKSESRYRSYINVTGQIGWVTNAGGEISEDVPSLRKFTGQTYEEAKGTGWAKALHPDDLERTLQVWENAVATKSIYEVEYRMRRHDGVYRDFLARGFPIFKEDGSIQEWVGTCIDITERKQTEQELKLSEEKFEKAFNSSPIPLSFTRLSDGFYLDCNEAFAKLVGYEYNEIISKSSIDLKLWITPEDREIFIRKLKETNSIRNVESRFRVKNGRIITTLMSSEIVSFREELCMLTVLNDITERKQAEEKLQQQLNELRRWQEVTLGREDRNMQLKTEVNKLLIRLGEPIRYPSQEKDKV